MRLFYSQKRKVLTWFWFVNNKLLHTPDSLANSYNEIKRYYVSELLLLFRYKKANNFVALFLIRLYIIIPFILSIIFHPSFVVYSCHLLGRTVQNHNIFRVDALTCSAATQNYWNKRKCLHKKRVELSQEWFGSTTCMDARRFIALNTNMAAAMSSAYTPYY